MTRCPRCHTSMVLDYTDIPGPPMERIWKCLGCGREFWPDPAKQRQEEQDLLGVQRVIAPTGR